MKIEDKQLLVKALCALLPYGVKVKVGSFIDKEELQSINSTSVSTQANEWNRVEYCKPYLRPMSKMTDEEKEQAQTFMDIVTDENYGDGYSPSAWNAMNGFVQYCDSHYLDHRGLIFRGIALEAPEGMY